GFSFLREGCGHGSAHQGAGQRKKREGRSGASTRKSGHSFPPILFVASERWRCASLHAALAVEPFSDDRAVVKLNGTAVLADEHQHVHRSRCPRQAGGRGALAGDRVHLEFALGAETPARGAGSYVLAEQKLL